MVKWYVLIYLFLEVVITIQVGSAIGGVNTFFEIIATGFLGFAILYNFKNSIAESMSELMQAKIDVKTLVAHNLLSFLGALLLILPGFVSDFFGILFQMKFITSPLAGLYKGPERRMRQRHFEGAERRINSEFTTTHIKGDEDVIDVEIIESDATKR